MKEALRQAKKAEKLGEIPIGCVIVKDGKIVARGYNRRNTDKNTLAHAELQAIRKAARQWETAAGGMYHVLTRNLVRCVPVPLYRQGFQESWIGCRNPKAGCAVDPNLLNVPAFNHQVELTEGILQEECSTLLKEFFRN